MDGGHMKPMSVLGKANATSCQVSAFACMCMTCADVNVDGVEC